MKRIRKCATAAQTVNATTTDSNRQLTFAFAVDRLLVSVLPASGTPQVSVGVNLANAATGTGTFSAPQANDFVCNFAPGVDQVYVIDLLEPRNTFKVTSANGAGAAVGVFVVGIQSADAG